MRTTGAIAKGLPSYSRSGEANESVHFLAGLKKGTVFVRMYDPTQKWAAPERGLGPPCLFRV